MDGVPVDPANRKYRNMQNQRARHLLPHQEVKAFELSLTARKRRATEENSDAAQTSVWRVLASHSCAKNKASIIKAKVKIRQAESVQTVS